MYSEYQAIHFDGLGTRLDKMINNDDKLIKISHCRLLTQNDKSDQVDSGNLHTGILKTHKLNLYTCIEMCYRQLYYILGKFIPTAHQLIRHGTTTHVPFIASGQGHPIWNSLWGASLTQVIILSSPGC